MRYIITVLFLFIITNSFGVSSGPKKGYTVIHDFKYDWLEFDNDTKEFVPQIADKSSTLKVHTLSINLDDYPEAYLLIQIKSPNNYLFFDKLLYKKLADSQWEVFSIEKVKSINKKIQLF